MSVHKVLRFGLMGVGGLLVILAALVYGRHSYIQSAVTVIETHGGGISGGDFSLCGFVPDGVTFWTPGNYVKPNDADAKPICNALSRFKRLEILDCTETSLGDPFFIELAQQCKIPWIQLRYTKCGDLGIQALANNGATKRLDIQGLTLSDETLALLKRKGIQHEYKPNDLPFSVKRANR